MTRAGKCITVEFEYRRIRFPGVEEWKRYHATRLPDVHEGEPGQHDLVPSARDVFQVQVAVPCDENGHFDEYTGEQYWAIADRLFQQAHPGSVLA